VFVRVKPFQSGLIHAGKATSLAYFENIRPGWKGWSVTNSLAYPLRQCWRIKASWNWLLVSMF